MSAAQGSRPEPSGFNPFDRSWWPDPYPTYTRLLAEQPTGQVGAAPVWWASRHADCDAALRDPRFSADDRNSVIVQALVAQRPAGARAAAAAGGHRAGAGSLAGEDDGEGELDGGAPRSLLRLDAPDHGRLRSLVAPFFTRSAIEDLRPMIERSVDVLLARSFAGEPVDVVGALGYPLPIAVISELLGVPPSWRPRLSELSRHVAAALDPEITVPAAELAVRRAAFEELRGLVRQLLDQAGERPATPLVLRLIGAESAGSCAASRRELLSLLVLLLVAGYETTANLIANTVLMLARRPDVAALARSSDQACAEVVEEVLRLDPPVQLTSRVTLEPVELGGLAVPGGHFVMLLLAAANRDPAAFDRPEELRLGRRESRVLSFSSGAHHCLGAALALVEATVAVRSLLRRWPRIELVERPRYRETLVLRGLERLLVAPVRAYA